MIRHFVRSVRTRPSQSIETYLNVRSTSLFPWNPVYECDIILLAAVYQIAWHTQIEMRLNSLPCSVRIALSPVEILHSLVNMLDVQVWEKARQAFIQ